MTETIWFLLVAWFLMLVLGYKMRQQFFLGLSAFVSIVLGFSLILEFMGLIGTIFIFSGIFLLGHTLFRMTKSTKGGN